MHLYRPVFEKGSSSPFVIIAFDKKDARDRLNTFLERNEDNLDYFEPEPIVDVELVRETTEGVVVL